MWSYEVENRFTKEVEFIMGYNFQDACRRAGLDTKEWYVVYGGEFYDD